jgi:hypothetical protein
MNEYTPVIIFDTIVITLFIIWVIHNSIITHDPLIMNLIWGV